MKFDLLKPNFLLGGYLPRALKNEVNLDPPEPNAAQEVWDEYFMLHAFLLSMEAIGWSAPNPAVGCVIVKNKIIIGKGFTQEYRHEHAERMAFNSVDPKIQAGLLEGATVYVTLEPCAHIGNQPPCLDLILNTDVKRVVIGCTDPDPRVSGRSIDAIRAAGKEVVLHILENECEAWHLPFLHSRLSKVETPLWVAKWARTPSGLLADGDGSSKWITSEHSRAYVHWLRQKYDAIAVGAGTWLADRPQLNVRDCAQPHRRNPLKLVYDPNGRLLSETLTNEPTRIFVKEDVLEHEERTLDLMNQVQWIPISAKQPILSFVNEANRLGVQSIMVEGGPTLLDLLFEKDVIKVCHVFTGAREFYNASDKFLIKNFKTTDFFQISDQKIDDDHLQEWVK